VFAYDSLRESTSRLGLHYALFPLFILCLLC
jgi:hypothetical protein